MRVYITDIIFVVREGFCEENTEQLSWHYEVK